MTINKPLETELDRQFPKGGKARGRALVVVAVANVEIEMEKKNTNVKSFQEGFNKAIYNIKTAFGFPENSNLSEMKQLVRKWVKNENDLIRKEVLEEIECRLVLPSKEKQLIKEYQWWLEVVYKVGTKEMKKKYPEPKNTNLWYGKRRK